MQACKTTCIAKALLAHGADVHAENSAGYTPLTSIALHCDMHHKGVHGSILKKTGLLLGAGADPRHRVTKGAYAGKTAAQIARSQDDRPACHALAEFLEGFESGQKTTRVIS